MQAVGPSFGRRLAKAESEAVAEQERRGAVSVVPLYGIIMPNPEHFNDAVTTWKCRFQVFMT
jgi:hypothetical protein